MSGVQHRRPRNCAHCGSALRFRVETSVDGTCTTWQECVPCQSANERVEIREKVPFRCPVCNGELLMTGRSLFERNTFFIGTECRQCKLPILWTGVRRANHQDIRDEHRTRQSTN